MSMLSNLLAYSAKPQALPGLSLPSMLQSPMQQKAPNTSSGPVDDLVSLSKSGIDLSAQDGLLDRVKQLGSATIDTAQNFINDFAKSLFGDGANAFSLSFDSASVATKSSAFGIVRHTENAQGTSDFAAFGLHETSDFVGKGQITTADGHSFSFEVTVHIETSMVSAFESRTSNSTGPSNQSVPVPAGVSPDAAPAPKDMKVSFPGNIADLFKLFDFTGRSHSFEMPEGAGHNKEPRHGNLTLRLLDHLAAPHPKDQLVAKAYGDNVPTNTVKESA